MHIYYAHYEGLNDIMHFKALEKALFFALANTHINNLVGSNLTFCIQMLMHQRMKQITTGKSTHPG